MTAIERRAFVLDELRVTEGEGRQIAGHAAVFNTRAEIFPGFVEEIMPGAFATAIQEDDVRALWNHNPDFVLGRNGRAKTLSLREDTQGLAVEIDPPPTTWANDLLISMRRGDVTQMSFGFRIRQAEEAESWGTLPDGSILRTIKQVELFDVSPVTYPAYPETDVAVRKRVAELRAQLGRAVGLGLDPSVARAKLRQLDAAR